MAERVECDTCGLKVNVRRDNTIAEHHYGPRAARERCSASNTQYDRHVGEFCSLGDEWVAECRCGQAWTGSTYAEVESQWRDHAARETEGVMTG